MSSILYKDNLIVSRAVFDQATGTWKPKIQLTLSLDRGKSFQTEAEAERAGIDAAKELMDSFGLRKSS